MLVDYKCNFYNIKINFENDPHDINIVSELSQSFNSWDKGIIISNNNYDKVVHKLAKEKCIELIDDDTSLRILIDTLLYHCHYDLYEYYDYLE